MAWRFPLSSTTTNADNQQLGDTDSLYVGTGINIFSSGGYTIFGTGSNQRVYIYGTAASGGSSTIVLGNNPSGDTGESVYIAKNARVDTYDSSSIIFHASNSRLTNAGEITADDYGVAFWGTGPNSISRVVNSGTISVSLVAIVRDLYTATETIEVHNTGLIQGGVGSYKAFGAVAKDQIFNSGTMNGEMQLDGGDDIYNGIAGHQTGIIYGGDGIDKLYGGTEANTFHGNNDADILMGYGGNDTLYGDAGADIINGGLGGDSLYGGIGLDNFVFAATTESTVALTGQDTIFDFSHAEGDKINLVAIDAKSGTVPNDAFSFIGLAAFSGVKGQLHYTHTATETTVSGDINGDRVADFAIHLHGNIALVAGDFLL